MFHNIYFLPLKKKLCFRLKLPDLPYIILHFHIVMHKCFNPNPTRITPFAGVLHPNYLTLLPHPHKNHTLQLSDYTLSHYPQEPHPLPITLRPSHNTLLPHPHNNHILCRYLSSIWPHHLPVPVAKVAMVKCTFIQVLCRSMGCGVKHMVSF